MKKLFTTTYLLTWIGFTILFFVRDIPLSFLIDEGALIIVHVAFVVLTLPIYLIRFLLIARKKRRSREALRKLLFRLVIPVVICFAIVRAVFVYNQSEAFDYTWNHGIENKTKTALNRFDNDGKLRGMSVYALGRNRRLNLQDIVKSNVEWLAVHPYMSQRSETSHEQMSLPAEIGQWSKRDSAFIKEIKEAKSKNFRILIKPHLWVNSGWRANINFDAPSDWNLWFKKYRTNMLHYAQLAEHTKSEMFCIGTELRSSLKKNDQWIQLIKEIRQIYSGKLTYAANWDDDTFYRNPEFWKSIDYIGIQAYYPLTNQERPELNEIKSGWDGYISDLKQLHITYNKPIIFTELGYRADTEATVKPWEWYSLWSPLLKSKSERTQLLAYEAFFQKIWHQDWFAGVFIWQWNNSADFSIQNKPAQNCITDWYSK